MDDERIITGVAGVLAAIAAVLALAAVSTGTLVIIPVAAAFGLAAYFMYDQLSGRMAARVYERVEERARVEDGRNAGGRARRRPGETLRDRARRARPDDPRANRTDGAGAGPREEWAPPRNGQTAREAAAGGRGRSQGNVAGRRRTAAQETRPGPSPADRAAYETLGLDPGADEEAIRTAYRDLVKEAHPDAPEGSRERFKAVKDAYEQLTE